MICGLLARAPLTRFLGGTRLDWRGQSVTSLTGCGQPRRNGKIYQNRISYKELSDILHLKNVKGKIKNAK
jgi:hypothetical protein